MRSSRYIFRHFFVNIVRMGKYISYLVTSFKANTAYKGDFALSIVFEMVYFYIYFALWRTIYTTSGDATIASYTVSAMVTYYFITALIYQIEPSNSVYLGNNIWTGYFTNDLIKPWKAQLVEIIYATGEIGFKALMYLPFLFFIYLTAHSYIILPTLPNLLYFIVTILLIFYLMLLLQLVMHALTFFFGDQEANIGLATYLIAFVGGGIVPLALLPAKIRSVVDVLPFRFIFNEPANIFLGKVSSSAILYDWLQIILWIAGLYIVFNFLFKRGLKRYTGIGR